MGGGAVAAAHGRAGTPLARREGIRGQEAEIPLWSSSASSNSPWTRKIGEWTLTCLESLLLDTRRSAGHTLSRAGSQANCACTAMHRSAASGGTVETQILATSEQPAVDDQPHPNVHPLLGWEAAVLA